MKTSNSETLRGFTEKYAKSIVNASLRAGDYGHSPTLSWADHIRTAKTIYGRKFARQLLVRVRELAT